MESPFRDPVNDGRDQADRSLGGPVGGAGATASGGRGVASAIGRRTMTRWTLGRGVNTAWKVVAVR